MNSNERNAFIRRITKELKSKHIDSFEHKFIDVWSKALSNEIIKLFPNNYALNFANQLTDKAQFIDWIIDNKGIEFNKQGEEKFLNEVTYENFRVFIKERILIEKDAEQKQKKLIEKEQEFVGIIKEIKPPQQTETETEQEIIEMKPVLKPEAVQIVFDIIKDFFSPEQQTELKQLIEKGNKASEKMLFKANGNRLTDTFKKLIEHDFITGCQKRDLINWIISNFAFTQQNKVKAFIYGTVEKTISRNDNPCKSPLIEIKNGQIKKVEQPRTKKYNKY
jgi:hypothetical protein